MLPRMTENALRRSTRASGKTTRGAYDVSRKMQQAKVDVSTFKKRKRTTSQASPRAKKVKEKSSTTDRSAAELTIKSKTSYSTGDIDDVTPPPNFTIRPAEPHKSNAPIIDTSQVLNLTIASTADATTHSILAKAEQHLISIDPRFKHAIARWPCPLFTPAGLAEPIDPFRSLVSGICGQQLSGASARACKIKFVALFNDNAPDRDMHVWPTPSQVARTSVDRLRLAGLSTRKAEYIQGLAQKFVDAELTTGLLLTAPDKTVMEKLVAIRGLGPWSVEMFMCFGLKRLDVLSTGDLGVQKGMAAWAGQDVSKLKAKGGGKWKYMSEKDMLEKSEPYKPYRSLFMWYMWRVADADVAVLSAES